LAGVVVCSPKLLLRSPGELQSACTRVKHLLGRSKHWRGGLVALQRQPGALARTLSFDSSRWEMRLVLLHRKTCCLSLLALLAFIAAKTSQDKELKSYLAPNNSNSLLVNRAAHPSHLWIFAKLGL